MMRRRRVLPSVLASALGLGLLVSAACTGDDAGTRRATPRPVDRAPDVDYTSTHLAKVNGTTTTTGLPETGSASIVGTVTGPGGPVPGATVRVEHLVGSGAVPRDVLTGADGRYALPGIPGGRYRVRAFLAPALATKASELRFLEDGKQTAVDLTLEDHRKVVARGAVAPSVPHLGEPVNLSVVVATQQVDPDGVVRSTPVPGLRVELDGLGAWSLRRDPFLQTPFAPRSSTTSTLPPSAVAVTDGLGSVQFELRCNTTGDPGLGVLVTVTVTPPAVEGEPPPIPTQQVQRLDLDLPECVDPNAVPPSTVTSSPVAGTSPEG